ncbi:rho GTPase-activating protein 12-like isoform X3 [Denticeps clupeoides]|uniref:Rho GTPase-activating protein 12-like n=1 Tax=Denticeps clupeoides TaxID=299321 RepID=A0AAY4ASW7_9TELE|nr:rho GTPase-activating protein 12-like isoform X3 [Denticeps clupeoides]
MADGRGDLTFAPGQVYVEVEYDYEYRSKDRVISIKQGDCFMLIRKTNEDWWQVRKEESDKPFYVPAQYVREARRALMPPPKPLPGMALIPTRRAGSMKDRPSALDIRHSEENVSTSTHPVHSPLPSPLSAGALMPTLPTRDSSGSPKGQGKGSKDQQPQNTSVQFNTSSSSQSNASASVGAHPSLQPKVSSSSTLSKTSPGVPAKPHVNAHTPSQSSPQAKNSPNSQTNAQTKPNCAAQANANTRAQCGSQGLVTSGGHSNAPSLAYHGSLPRTIGPAMLMDLERELESRREKEKDGGSRNDSESGDELSSSSTEQLQTRPDSPVYANLQDMKISTSSQPPVPSSSPLHTFGEWETHRDFGGRHYYYNTVTYERSWKPPRTKDRDSLSRGRDESSTILPLVDAEILSSEEAYLSTYSSQSDSQYGSPPRGWSEELDEYGHTLYVCDYTNEKWIKHTDEQGRSYYYSADGSRSEWELPKLGQRAGFNNSLPNQDTPKTRSLDRRLPEPIVLTKRRQSIHMVETNDKDIPKPSTPDSDSSCPPSPKPHSSPSEKCGVLNVTKITEHGKKVRKNWTSSWTVLQGSSLLFAKNQGSGTSWFGSHQSKPEFSVDLRGGTVDFASKDKSSKKNVLELKTRQGTELLIQSDNENVIYEWLRAITETINTHAWESDEAIEEDMPESPGPEKQDKEKEHRDSKKQKVTSSTSIDVSDQKKRTKLKKFLTRRPTLQAVRDKGYIKDQVFGCSLDNLCQRENTSVPLFVKKCIDHVENYGLNVDGLYRVSGNLAVIQKLRFAVNHDERVDLADAKWEDIHVTTGALKMFFRELPEPLFTYTYFNDFVNAIKIYDYKQKLQAVKDLVKLLPQQNHDTMQALFKHLRKVIEHGEQNRMTTQSVAIVFGPTLLRPEKETLNMAVHMVYQNQIVELILLEYDGIFGR